MANPIPPKQTRAGLLVLRGAGMRMFAILVNAIGTLALLPIAVRELGDYWFGILMLVGAVVVQYQVLDFGMSQTVVRFLSKHRADGNDVGVRQVFSTTITAFLALSAVTILIVLGALAYLDATVPDPERRETLLWVVALFGCTAALSFPTFVLEGSLTAAMRQDIASVLQLFRAASRIGLSYWVLLSGFGIIGVAAVAVGTDMVYRVLVWRLVWRVYPQLRFQRDLVSWPYFKEMLSFGRFVFLTNISKFSLMHSSVIVVSSLISVSATTTYAIGLNVIARLENLIRLGFFIAMPAFTNIATQTTGYRFLRERFYTVTRVVTYGVSLIGGGLIFAGYDFIQAWIGPDYRDAYWPLLILMSAWMVELCQIPALQLMTAIGKHRRFAYYDFGVACVSVAGACALAIPYGIIGVAFGVGVPVALSAILLKSRNVCEELGIPLLAYLWQIGRIMGGSLALQVPVWLLLRQFPGMNLLELFAFGCLTYGPLALIVLLMVVPRSDQRYLVELLPARLARRIRRVLPHLRPQ